MTNFKLAPCFAIFFATFFVSYSYSEHITIDAGSFEVKPPSGKLPAVPDSKVCGGEGKVEQLRIQGCTASPCKLEANGKKVDAELDIIPARDSPELKISIWYDTDPPTQQGFVVDKTIRNSAVKAGTKYTIAVSGTVDASLKGRTVVATLIVHNSPDTFIVACSTSRVLFA